MIGDYDLELLDLFSSCPANFGFLVASVLLSLVSYQEDNFEHSPAFEMLHDRWECLFECDHIFSVYGFMMIHCYASSGVYI